MKRWVVLGLLMIPLLAWADSYWEGNAALQRGDAAFESGLYAESDSFAPDTQLMVQNLDNGKSTVVTVSQRADSQSNILILLSPRAADALGIAAGSIARVRVTEEQKAASTGTPAAPEKSFNPDSDVNPGAAYAEEPAAGSQAPAAAASQPDQTPAATQQEQTAAQDQTAQPDQAAGASAESQAAAEDAQILADAASRNPQKQLFLPPREDQKFAYKPPAETQAAQTPQPAEAPTVTGETAAPSQQQSETPLAEAQPASPQEAGSSTAQPSQPEASSQLALPEAGGQEAKPTGQATEANGTPPAPSGEKIALQPPETPQEQAPPVQTTTAPAAKTPPETPPGQAQVVASLPKLTGKKNAATFYVQLGAYATQEVAQGLAGTLIQTYPVVVLAPASGDKPMFRVLVGPLNKAESGTLLPLFKFRGFRDAFVRRE